MISIFRGKHRFLSNFYPCHVKIYWEEMYFDTTEHAYQAAKTLDKTERLQIQQAATPGEAKKLGQKVSLRRHWNNIKNDIMLELVRQKFVFNYDLAQRLLDTKDQELVEGNTWHDNWFGSCVCLKCGDKGQNWLGKILMEVRDQLNNVTHITLTKKY